MSAPAITADGLGKRYRRGLQLQPYKTARESLVRLARAPLGGLRPKREDDRWFWALRDISFELQQGEALGVVGRNGAGKTTLLKVLSRITRPSAGRAEVYGRVGTLLEVGTAFHPELTGRENIKLQGAILGMPRGQIARRFDEIVEFAEIGPFVDTPVKRYSSGMYMRLAFAVAAHLEPDILIVDEVLAVGDAAFQRKCLGKLDEVGGEGRTVIFVSHNMAAVSQLCTRGLLIDQGRIALDAPVDEVVDAYMLGVADTAEEVVFDNDPDRPACFVRLAAKTADGRATTRFGNDEPIVMEAEFQVNRRLVGDHVWLILYRADGLMLSKVNDDDAGGPVPEVREPGRHVVRFTYPAHVLNEAAYQFRVVIGKRLKGEHDDRLSGYFDVEDMTDYSASDFGKRNGALLVPVPSHEERVGDAGDVRDAAGQGASA
ncbi:MAG TPA: polysaccharide ABC transporter ATP-binding protein [Solirubrobacteraceae bacterium]|jgi:lipopolysaccharide transport system ATP-binding protein|nr:polysaccharide ABC transporter ATP-binding protein [Solirubrobacteraceae bacterium]